ncbi:NAD-dependent epimerase/dehydratase family protein [Shinella zoogloeoides]|uniref:NAD-dependent epimerase/dehydratase family protein n=1 Tax=Shinella zoogloeoides TaxID=352475 RepID=A0A6N8TE03_SHIZO|nr:NAD(P)-dependent oxidoreductase [Shinella zoogloeoides]MXO01169.1 NAD-dependent epimerase/dehydratase family protein [Shinella zoogloeoides]UEX84298.1 NAD(P)-dependent oxidoreductase [Shinella zoogloeoides]
MKRLLITGAAGALGRALKPRLAPLAETLRLADIVPLAPAGAHEEHVTCDLADAAAVDAMVEGCDGIVHLGGISVERPFAQILGGNIVGLYNLYEAARAHGLPRIVFASSNHTIGYYPQTERLGPDAPYRPDGLYGVSKCFGEALARMYFEKFGQETALVRIGSCTPEPTNHRMLSTWFSEDDFAGLIAAAFRAPVLGCPVVWGASANDAGWWDNSHLGWLGWTPKDNAEDFRAKVEAAGPPPRADEAMARYQGGGFVDNPIFKE